MSIHIEFFGVPRARAGVAAVDVVADDLAGALRAAEARLPRFGEACLSGGALMNNYVANINGSHFTRDGAAALRSGDTVLILSADAGG